MENMNKRTILAVLLTALLIVLGVASAISCESETEIPAISKDQAIAILVSEIIEPAAEYKGISASMLSQPLRNGDVVTSEGGQTYSINANTWFTFIDDDPLAFFAHDCRYVLINAQTGSYDVKNETWPPEINNLSMWDMRNLDRGTLIGLYSILDSAIPVSGSLSQAPRGDYGDAPDGQDAYYGVRGRYPTLFGTTNNQLGRPGAHALNIGEETLGVHVSAEADATDPADPDGVPNLVDADSDERIFVVVDGAQAKLAFTATVAPNAPDVTRYANALIDFDQNGSWSARTYGTEWVVVNLAVDAAPGSAETVITPWFSWGNKAVLPSPVWMRLLLSRENVDQALFANVGGWDGSGQFEYGEVEDYFVFLTDKAALVGYTRWPPAPGQPPQGDGKLPPGGGGEPPGPRQGPCGYDINYYVVIISGGDSAGDLAEGHTIVQDSVDAMAALASDQGYVAMGNLEPGNNSLSDIGDAFDRLAANVKCGDHVLVYICGHGYAAGGIALKNASGTTQEVLGTTDGDSEDNSLEDFLNKIPPCPDEDCETPGKCCHVTVIIESCFAGNFNVPGVTGQGRTVIGTSADTSSYATYPGGGIYTQGFDEDSRDSASDADEDGYVNPLEAHVSAVAAVDVFNDNHQKSQTPWTNSQECECKCPCKPSIDGDKWVWDGISGRWVDEIQANPGQLVRFRLEVENDGKCRNVTEPKMVDELPSCLQYIQGSALVLFDGRGQPRAPEIGPGQTGLQLVWDLRDVTLAPGETIAIEFDAIAVEPGPNENMLAASAKCSVDPSIVVSDQDTATVNVLSSPPRT